MASTVVAIREFIRRFGLLITLSATVAIYYCAFLAYGMAPSAEGFFLASYVLPIASAIWVQRDARKRKCTPCFDFGSFMFFTWLFSVPAYLIWQYGWRGLALAGLFFGIWIAPTVAYMAFWIYKFG